MPSSSSFPGASPSSSASSHLSYLIPPARPPPLLLTGQGYSCVDNGVPTSGVVDVGSSAAASVMAPPRPAAGTRQPLPRPPPRQCPRCGSPNTKFCYYNNYSRSQPRYRCKACRRHWTEGGTLRDVPVGGGRKQNRRGTKKASSSSSSSSATALPLQQGQDVASSFPDNLRQVLFQPVGTMAAGGGYSIDLSAWHQMAAPTQQGTGDAGALGGNGTTTMDANCSALQYWSGWQQDDVPGLDGAC